MERLKRVWRDKLLADPSKLAKEADVSEKTAKTFLRGREAYLVHRRRAKRSPRFFQISAPFLQIAMDTMFIPRRMVGISRYKYAIIGIDCFSRKAYGYPITKITSENASKALESFMGEMKKPDSLSSCLVDQGTEFTGKIFLDFLKSKNIDPIFTLEQHKSKTVLTERLIRTLKNNMAHIFTVSGKIKDPKQILAAAIRNYNRTTHITLGRSPLEAEADPDSTLEFILLQRMIKRDRRARPETIGALKVFEVGDLVRKEIPRKEFGKESDPSFSSSSYQVRELLVRDPESVYKLERIQDKIPLPGS